MAGLHLHSSFLGLFIPAVFAQEGQFQNGEMGSLHAVGKSGEQAESGHLQGHAYSFKKYSVLSVCPDLCQALGIKQQLPSGKVAYGRRRETR